MKTHTTVSLVLATLLIGGTPLLAEPGDNGVDGAHAWKESVEKRVEHTDGFGGTYYSYSKEAPKGCVNTAVKKYSQRVNQAPKEVIEGLHATFEADKALRAEDDAGAIKALATADTQFKAAFKANPDLKMIPVDTDIVVAGIDASPSEIKTLLHSADSAVTAHRTQEARALLMPLRDEIDVTTLYLPAAAYADAVSAAQKAMSKGDRVAASKALDTAFGLLVSDRLVMPISLLDAQARIDEAAALDKEAKTRRSELLDAALADLQKAELLGYTGKHSQAYTDLSRQIKQVKLDHSSEAGKLYQSLKIDFNKLLDAIEGEVPFVGS
jgi:hypothetical protein